MSNNTLIYIVDFEDSFTYNIANILFPYTNKIEVLNHKTFFLENFQNIILKPNIAIILGPGPGHPEQYKNYFKQIKILQNTTSLYLMGICLGHQLIALQLNYKILRSRNPQHGEPIQLDWNNQIYSVQRYNSLAVLSHENNSEIMLLEYHNGRSYQFHPESVGSDNPIDFFLDLLFFIGIS